MASLREWITGLQTSILERRDQLDDMIQPSHLERQVRLEVYQNAYLLRLAEALQTNFPALYSILGEDAFGHMMLAYLSFESPSAASIRWFGNHLEAFLRTVAPYSHDPVLSEIASVEWALRHTVDAADAIRCSYEEISSLTPDEWLNLKLILHPSVSVLNHRWNAVAIANAETRNEKIPDRTNQRSDWLLYRSIEGSAAWRSVTVAECKALRSTASGITFTELCEGFAESDADMTEVASLIVGFLRMWVEEGILVRG
jgi:Putative DNA-binding domain